MKGPKMVTRKFKKDVDSGPLGEGLDEETAQTIQDERIRRQVAGSIYPGPQAAKAKKVKRAKIAAIRGGY